MAIPNLFKRRRKVFKSPKVFSSTGKQIVIPYRPMGAILILLLVFLCLFLFFRSDIFLIHSVAAVRTGSPNQTQFISEKNISDALIDIRGRSIFSTDFNAERKRILSEYLSVKTVSFEKKLPDTLRVTFEEREPVAILEAKNGSYLLDGEGLLFAQAPEGLTAPTFQNRDKEMVLGEYIDSKEAAAAITLVTGFNNSALYKALSFDFNAYPTITIKTQENVDVYFDAEGDIADQLSTLQLIVKNATIEGKSIKKVDLRFKRPVVSY